MEEHPRDVSSRGSRMAEPNFGGNLSKERDSDTCFLCSFFLLYFTASSPLPKHTHTPVLCRLFLSLVEAWYVPSSREANTGDSEGGMYRTREAFCSSFVVASFPFAESLPLPPFLRTKWVQVCGPPPRFPGRECGFET